MSEHSLPHISAVFPAQGRMDHAQPKPLPEPARHEKLPPPPPTESLNPPLPPPKLDSDSGSHPPRSALQLSQESSSDPGTPASPTTTTHPISLSADARQKKSNPLVDLIDTEKLYVDQMTGIIRKVASAWSRSNLPPPELDSIFRSIESVYKANRSLLSKLKEIGTNPSSPKALGDLLMRWIDDLEGAYTSYCDRYCTGFDVWEPVQSNERLPTVLASFSASNPPPPSAADATWTLDALFSLPKGRLKYYKKLYNRLLRSTAPGRSDYRLLVGALDKLDRLLSALESRGGIKVGSSSSSAPVTGAEDEVVIDMRAHSMDHKVESNGEFRATGLNVRPGSESTSSGGERSSRETVSTSISRGSTTTLSMPISDLERRLATDRTVDIFTMNSKIVRLQMAPPFLAFTRELRFSIDVSITLTPTSTGVEVVHRLGHVFLLSDLFLVCERMTPEERASGGRDGPDMWLCYPPLSGKVLRVSEVSGQDNALQVVIMRKEVLVIQTESPQVRNFIMAEFKECIAFSGTVSSSSKQPPPPLPPLDTFPRSIPASLPSQYSSPSDPPQGPRRSMTPPTRRSFSPSNVNGSSPISRPHENDISQPERTRSPISPTPDAGMSNNMANLVLSPEAQIQPGAQRVPSLHDPLPGPMYTRTSAQVFAGTMSSGPEPAPPMRTTSFGSSPQDLPVRPGQVMATGQPTPPSFHQYSIPSPSLSFPTRQQPLPAQYGAPLGGPPSDPAVLGGIRKSLSSRSLGSQFESHGQYRAPPLPPFPGGYPPPNIHDNIPRSNSYSSLAAVLPSVNSRSVSMADSSFLDPSPPNSPIEEIAPTGPVISTISAQMKCKVFLKQQHAQWKALGAAKLKLYQQDPTNIKQLVVEADNKAKSVLISTIVLTDGVERVGKTGVAVELSDKGLRTGIIYMIQLRNETSAGGLFDSLLAGSDRAGRG